jgi:hypothetical protein
MEFKIKEGGEKSIKICQKNYSVFDKNYALKYFNVKYNKNYNISFINIF